MGFSPSAAGTTALQFCIVRVEKLFTCNPNLFYLEQVVDVSELIPQEAKIIPGEANPDLFFLPQKGEVDLSVHVSFLAGPDKTVASSCSPKEQGI